MQTMIEKLIELDTRYSERLRLQTESSVIMKMASVFAHSGDSWFWLIGLVLIWFLGNPEWQDKSAILAISLVIMAVFVLALKFTIRRRRPEGEWGAIYRKTDPHSFPSGHAARAGLLAVMALGVGPLWFGILLLVWAPLVSLARIVMGVHYLTDVLAGFMIGTLAGWILLNFSWVYYRFLPFLFS